MTTDTYYQVLANIEKIQDIIRHDLNYYKSTKNPKQFILDKKENMIMLLQSIYNDVEKLNRFEIYYALDHEINRLLSLDPEIERFKITIDIKPFTQRQSNIYIQSYENA